MLLKLNIATPEERRALGPLRAGAWAGTLTEAQLLAPAETFTAVVEGLNLPPLTVTTVA